MWALLFLPLVSALTTPTIIPLSPTGVRWVIPDAGYDMVAVHFSVNEQLVGTEAGKYNYDINSKQGNNWVLNVQNVHLKDGDTIHYWLYALVGGLGQQDLNQLWTYSSPTQAPPQTSQTTETTTATTINNTPLQYSAQSTEAPSTGTTENCCYDQPSQNKACTSFPCLIFEDNFDTLNMKVWEHEITAGGGGNWEFQYYTNNRSNSYVKNGVLYIKPTLTSDRFDLNFLQHGKLELWGDGPYDTCTGNSFYGCQRDGSPGNIINPIQSARLRSSRGFNFKYGKVEIEAKLPKGDWIWPAIWMRPTYDAYGEWPASGEIDIMESRGNRHYHDQHGKSQGVNHMGSTLHFGPNTANNRWDLAHAERDSKSRTFGDDFHKYGMEWTEDHIKFFLDDQEILSVDPGLHGFWHYGGFDKTGMENPWRSGSKMAPFDQEFYLILNVAVGGLSYFPDHLVNVPYAKPWKNADQTAFWNARNQWYPTWNPNQNNGEDAAMKINYVKVWRLK